ncbi:MAG: permease [Candidatus Saccharibacteria bacterium]|nr:permease [Candidatus Saccharibacteria bacterium]
MLALTWAVTATIAAFIGGLFVFRNRRHLHNILGLTAGVLIGAVAFDLLPEIFDTLSDLNQQPTFAMIGLVAGFLLFHIIEKGLALHRTHSSPETPTEQEQHGHHSVLATGLALCFHSLLDGIAIGVSFQADSRIGLAVAIAVVAHRFSDGINIVSLVLARHKSDLRLARIFLVAVALAPIVGVLLTLMLTISPAVLVIYLAFIAGFLLHIVASEVLPEAHGHHSTYLSIALTVVGVVFMFVVSHYASI